MGGAEPLSSGFAVNVLSDGAPGRWSSHPHPRREKPTALPPSGGLACGKESGKAAGASPCSHGRQGSRYSVSADPQSRGQTALTAPSRLPELWED